MRGYAVAAVCSAAFFATGAMAQVTTPTTTAGGSAPQAPTTAAPEAPMFSPNKFGPVAIAYNAGVTNDYVFRGVSQTKGSVAFQGGVDFTYNNLYLGTWVSNLDFSPFGDKSTNTEIDLYGGVKTTFSGISLDIGGIYYGYAGQPTGGPSVDYYEGYVKATKAFNALTVGASIYVSPDFTGETGTAEYFEANAAYAINKKISVSGAVGRQEIEKVDGYTTWNVGATVALTDNLSLDLRYYDTDEHGFGKPYDSKGVALIKLSF